MAGIKFRIEVKTQDVETLIEDLEQKLGPVGVNAFMKNKGTELLHRRVTRRFLSEGDSASGKWAPLKHGTQGFRKKQGFPAKHPINVRTGAMFEWAVSQRSKVEGGGDNTSITYPGKQPTGEMLKKVNTAQTGRRAQTKKGRGETVPRPIFAVSQRDMFDFISSLEHFVLRGQ